MNKTIAYIFFVGAAVWLIDGFYRFFTTQELYHIFLSYNTPNKYYFLLFKTLTGALVILAGMRRLRMSKES